MLFREHLIGPPDGGIPREILGVHLSGRQPDTQLIIRYRDMLDGNEHTVRWGLWYDLDPIHGPRFYDAPPFVVSNFIHQWHAGEIDPEA